jgi:uncharacterized protein (TIGR02246 family)
MKKGVLIVVTVLMTAAFACGAPVAQELPPADQAAVQALLDLYASAMNSGDTARWIELWHDDGVMVSQDGLAIAGKTAIRVAARPLIENFTNDLALTCDDVTMSGNFAFVRGCYSLTARTKMSMEEHVPRWVAEPSASTLESEGTFLLVLMRQSDGSWKVYRETRIQT